ncbi:MAG: nuclear transport factor 2 family protein [Solirubrobacterales bacterium]
MSGSETERERNLALLGEGIEAYNRGDLGFVVEHAADDIDVFVHGELINTGRYRGREDFERWMGQWQEAWSEITIEVRDIDTIGDNHLLVGVGQKAIGAASGVPVEMDIFQVIEVRDGKISRFHLYPDREKAEAALKDLGAQPPAG